MEKTFIFMSKPRHVTPQIDCLGITSPVLRASTDIYECFQGHKWQNVHFATIPRQVNPQLDHLGKTSPCSEGFKTHLCIF